MEPGHEDREYPSRAGPRPSVSTPQWSPVMKTGNTWPALAGGVGDIDPQWSPVMKTGNTWLPGPRRPLPATLNGARS